MTARFRTDIIAWPHTADARYETLAAAGRDLAALLAGDLDTTQIVEVVDSRPAAAKGSVALYVTFLAEGHAEAMAAARRAVRALGAPTDVLVHQVTA